MSGKKKITLKTLPTATAQEVFDQVVGHLLRQGERCAGPVHRHEFRFGLLDVDIGKPYCLYRNNEGMKCAAGCLIGDDEYRLSMEGHAWGEIAPEEHAELIITLQLIHDLYTPSIWASKLRDLAIARHLDPGIIGETIRGR